MGGLARELDVAIVAGFCERLPESEVANSAALIDAQGVRAIYRKAHLWHEESTIFTAGDRPPPVVETRFGRLAVMICYDLEFPEWVRLPALAGAQLLCAPVNWPLAPRPQGERPAEMVKAQANAAVNRLFIAVCDRCETERGVAWIGGSVIVDADGYPLTQSLEGEGMVLASMDLGTADDSTSAATITCIAIGGRCCIETAGAVGGPGCSAERLCRWGKSAVWALIASPISSASDTENAADGGHSQRGVVGPRELQLRHIGEVHAVQAEDHRRDGQNRPQPASRFTTSFCLTVTSARLTCMALVSISRMSSMLLTT